MRPVSPFACSASSRSPAVRHMTCLPRSAPGCRVLAERTVLAEMLSISKLPNSLTDFGFIYRVTESPDIRATGLQSHKFSQHAQILRSQSYRAHSTPNSSTEFGFIYRVTESPNIRATGLQSLSAER